VIAGLTYGAYSMNVPALWRAQSYYWVWGFQRVCRQRAILTTGMSRFELMPNHLNDIKIVTLTRIRRGVQPLANSVQKIRFATAKERLP
jgi:hypothetical protein